MENEYVCMVPRNLNKPDQVSFGRFSLSWKQIGYLTVGGAITYLTFQSGLPIVVKIGISALGFGASVTASFYKPKGVELDELLLNSLIYAQRKTYYHTMEKAGGMVVTIKSKEEGNTITTRTKTFTLQPT